MPRVPATAKAAKPASSGDPLQDAFSQIRKAFGAGAVMFMGDSPIVPIGTVPSGAVTLDMALGIGGLPLGRIVEIFGPEQGGKTTMALSALAQAQKKGLKAAFIDAEHALSPEYAQAIGVDTDNLIIAQPDCGEEALEIAETLVRSGRVHFIVIDSVAALVPRAEIAGEMGDSHPGLQARLMSQALRKLTPPVAENGTCLVFINQMREMIGVMFGSPETTSGGKALKFYASVRLDVRKIETLKDGNEAVGNRVRIKVVKNKLAPPFRQAELDIIFGQGINREGCLLDVGVQMGLVTKAGSHYTYKETAIGNGRAAAARYLLDCKDLADELEAAIKAWKLPGSEPAQETAPAPDTALPV